MTTKECLNRARETNNRIKSMKEQLEILENVTCKATPSYSLAKVNGGNEGTSAENAIVKLIDVKAKLDEMIGTFCIQYCEIQETINALDSEKIRLLFELRYLCFNDWETIAQKMQFSVSYVLKLHGIALRELEEIKAVTVVKT